MLLTEQEYRDTIKARPRVHPLCQQLRALRAAAGISLLRFEEKYGVSAVVLGSYERGDREPPLRKLDAIFGAYGYHLAAVPIGTQAVRLSGDLVTDLRLIADQLEARLKEDE